MIDEYDKPILDVLDTGLETVVGENRMSLEDRNRNVLKGFYSVFKAADEHLQFVFLTGVTKFSQVSVFSGFNQPKDISMDPRYEALCGITQEELDNYFMGSIAGMAEIYRQDAEGMRQMLKRQYDGYHFGCFDVYCPWDVMNYLRDLQHNPSMKPESYWKNTSDNAIISSFIDYAGSSITMKLEKLLSGGYIFQKIEENLTYDYLHSSEDNLWSILYLTGYLTRVREMDIQETIPDGTTALMIPNREIKDIFESTIIKWFNESTKHWNRTELFHAVWDGNSDRMTDEMNKLLRKTISYHDYREDFYHAFLAGIFTGAGYVVESNKEHGEGRSDVIVYDSENGQLALFEVKYSSTLDQMKQSCQKALAQIDEKMYAKEFEDSYDKILCYGIAFFKKRCLVYLKD